jgi:phosphohistidine phosphatase SixA
MKYLTPFIAVGFSLFALTSTAFAKDANHLTPLIKADRASMLSSDELIKQLREGGLTLMIRHTSTTEGLGDPENFSLADCGTQRNLSDAGRKDAVRMGAALREQNIVIADVLSSPWCRTRDTAKLAFDRSTDFMPISALPSESKASDVAMLLKSHNSKSRTVGSANQRGNLALVTHNDNIKLLTGLSVNQGDIVVVKNDRGALVVSGVLSLNVLLNIDQPAVSPATLKLVSATPSRTAVVRQIAPDFLLDRGMIGSCSGIDPRKLDFRKHADMIAKNQVRESNSVTK